MKSTTLDYKVLIALMVAMSGCVSNRFHSAQISEIFLYDGIPRELVRTINTPDDLALFVAILARSDLRKNTNEAVRKSLWTGRCFDIRSTNSTAGRWLYDENTDRIARMDIWSGRYVYTPLDADQSKLRELLELRPNASP